MRSRVLDRRLRRRGKRAAILGWTFALALGCGHSTPPDDEIEETTEGPAPVCEATARVEGRLPGVRPEHETLEYWVRRAATLGDVDAPLLTVDEIRAHRDALHVPAGEPNQPDSPAHPTGQWRLDTPLAPRELALHLNERFAYLRGMFRDRYVTREGDAIPAEQRRRVRAIDPDAPLPLTRELRVALEDIPVRCAPFESPYYKTPVDPDFDRNSCSTVRAQEPVQVLMSWPGDEGLSLVRTGYTLGFIGRDAPLSPPVAAEFEAAYERGPRARLGRDQEIGGRALPAGTALPLTESDAVLVASPEGIQSMSRPSDAISTERPLTRRGVLQEAFRLLGAPYGWGGQAGGRDCSRFTLDVFSAFGLPIPRYSARQARAGSFSVDVSDMAPEEKLQALDQAASAGIVLIHFPGHIMLYLGRTEEGRPMAIHAFSEYLRPCAPVAPPRSGEEGFLRPSTLMRVDRVAVSGLTLGARSERGSFLERATRLVVFGPPPPAELEPHATLRPPTPPARPPPEACEDSTEIALFQSPRRANTEQAFRLIATASQDLGPVALAFYGPEGTRIVPRTYRLGGPPYSYFAETEELTPGEWVAVLGEGGRTLGCETFTVHRHRGGARRHEANVDPAWRSYWRWEEDTENLYAAFVEQLFSPAQRRGAETQVQTWPNLSALLRDPERNLLHGHVNGREDERIFLRPDCADLPYLLRAYFAWKLHLPFAFRSCNRGGDGEPPTCDATPRNNFLPVEGDDEVEAFQIFSRVVAGAVHSASARTRPTSNATDVYPVPLTREALTPGTVFADPYGHLLIIARWASQDGDTPGVLYGADAQPDGTVGIRRFWRGSFLFSPETQLAGPGFKAWRPVRGGGGRMFVRRNDRITEGPRPFSMQQYQGDADAFYDRMEALINPRPLNPSAQLEALVDALAESVERRIVSVDNGERYVREHPRETIPMPEGHAIFETTGPWEDFATPSRDMRLLISIHAVTGFPASVERQRARFGLDASGARELRARLESELDAALGDRSFAYRRSDGSEFTFTLAQVVERRPQLEVAYNPNDCVELRWGATLGTPEAAACRRRAPAHQQARMASYRPWFRDRRRPAR